MKISKRLLAAILSLAVLFVSLPMAFSASAAELPDTLENTGAGKLVYAYDFNDGSYAEGAAIPSGIIYGGAGANPKLPFGWPPSSGGSVSAKIGTHDGKTVLSYVTSGCDAVLLFPEVTTKNYVYEATFYSTNGTANAGICNLSWGDAISNIKGAAWFVAKPGTTASSYVSVKGKDNGDYLPSTIDNLEVKLSTAGTSTTAGEWYTFKMICYNNVNYYFINDVYYGCVDVSTTMNQYTTGGRVGIYTYGSTMHVSSLSVREYGEAVQSTVWNGSFDAALPTADEDGDGEIEIRTAEQFAAVAKSTGLDASGNRIKYELVSDIALNDTSVEGWKDNNPNKWLDPVKLGDISNENCFYGIINGNGYVVRGVYVDKVYAEGEITRTAFAEQNAKYDAASVVASGTELDLYEDVYAGLFPVVGKGAAFVGLGMEDSYISVKDSSAPITLIKDNEVRPMNIIGSVGMFGVVANSGINKAIIDQCYMDTSVELVGARTGMIACGNKCENNLVVSNCYASATITVFRGTAGTGWDNNVGNRFMLISGNESRPLVYSCYTLGNLTNNGACDKNVNGVNNVYYYSGWANSSFATSVDVNAIKGDNAKKVMFNLDWTKFETKPDSRPVLKIFSTHNQGTEGSVWDGTNVQPTSDLDNNGYVEITNAAQLNWVVSHGNGNYELAKDIWINDITVYGAGGFFLADRAPKVWSNSDWFKGNFKGNGKVVHGIFYNTEPTENNNQIRSGLFSDIAPNTTITGLGIQDSFIRNSSGYSMGAIVGYANSGSGAVIDQCFVDQSVYVRGYKGVGGFIGCGNTTLTIKNSYSTAYVSAAASDGRSAGFVGDAWTGNVLTLQNIYTANAKLTGNAIALKSVSAAYSTAWSNTGATTVSRDKMLGVSALTNMPNLNANGAFQATARYPMLRIFDPDYVEEEEVGEVWNGSIAGAYAGGTGTENDPYIISKGSQLAKAINSFGENGAYFKLDRDIYLNDVSKADWTKNANYWFEGVSGTDEYYYYNSYKAKIGEFTKTGNINVFNGNIDGNGFHVYGVCYPENATSFSAALIPAVGGGTFKNLGLDHFYLNAIDTAAAFAAFTCKYSAPIVIDNCYIGEDIRLAAGDAKGGFIGYANGGNGNYPITISNSYVLIPAINLGGYGLKNCAFISETWLTKYYLKNCYSVAQPINPVNEKERASTAYADDLSKISEVLSNVFCLENGGIEFGNYEKYDDGNGNVTKAFTTLSASQMRGTRVFDNMTINGDNRFIYNIGYPSLAIFGNVVPTEAELLEGLTKVGTMNESASFVVPTETLVYSTTFNAGAAETLTFGDCSVQVSADGVVTIVGEETATKQFTLSGTANLKVYVVGGFMIVYVNDQCAGLVSVELAPNTTFVKTGANAATVDLYIVDVKYNGVSFGDVNVQLKDVLGNNLGGVKLDVTINESDAINSFGYETEYGVLVSIGDEIVDEITADNAKAYALVGTKNFEITGLGADKQELFFNFRGYAKIKVNNEIEYYYYGDNTTVFSPIYEANKLYDNEIYKDAIKATYGASDKFIENCTGDIEFTAFGDYHYKTGMYTSILSDMKAVVDKSHTLNGGQGADFILSLGDMSNDWRGSKEVSNYVLDGIYSFRGVNETNAQPYPFFNLYGNHELESANNSMEVATKILTNYTGSVWGDGTVDRIPNDLTKGYYYADINGFRLIITDTNYSWNPNHINGEVVGWEHNLTASYGSPLASHNAARGFDEGAGAAANTYTNSLGPEQLEWLEAVLMDAVEQGIPCIVAGHSPMADAFGSGGDAKQVRALYKKANDIRKGTVLTSINGHQHTNRQTVVEDVLYLDITTVRNSEWRETSEPHYNNNHTTIVDYYDDNGKWTSQSTVALNSLGMGKQTWFANDPVFSTIKITQKGTIEMTGMKTKYMYDVIPDGYKDYGYPGQNSGYWTLGDAQFTVTEIAWPTR